MAHSGWLASSVQIDTVVLQSWRHPPRPLLIQFTAQKQSFSTRLVHSDPCPSDSVITLWYRFVCACLLSAVNDNCSNRVSTTLVLNTRSSSPAICPPLSTFQTGYKITPTCGPETSSSIRVSSQSVPSHIRVVPSRSWIAHLFSVREPLLHSETDW